MGPSPKPDRRHARWAELRFSVVGPLLASPPARGELHGELEKLAAKEWRHPITAEPVRFGVSTLERWYYKALHERQDPVGVLRRRVRRDSGQQRSVGAQLKPVVFEQYRAHKRWSCRLHYDNLAVRVEEKPELGPLPSYPTLVRFMRRHGLVRTKGRPHEDRPGMQRAAERLEQREVRSYEAEYVSGLWHLDFHHGSLKVLLANGTWVRPLLLGVLDDRSRLCCHAQWYLAESSENLVHGLSQAFEKRALPRALMTDNGAAMMAGEVRQGLTRLGILHETTLPYSPYQNAKQEVFWAQVEGRLMAMLEGEKDLGLAPLNETTLAWVEMEYNRRLHSETGETPLERYVAGPDVGRESPQSESLRQAFTAEVLRTQRRSDGTVSLEGVRFEIPSRYRHLRRLAIRYASWDLSRVFLCDETSGTPLSSLYPLDKTKNASGERRSLEPVLSLHQSHAASKDGMAPLLRKLLALYAATGLPPAYVPKDDLKEES